MHEKISAVVKLPLAVLAFLVLLFSGSLASTSQGFVGSVLRETGAALGDYGSQRVIAIGLVECVTCFIMLRVIDNLKVRHNVLLRDWLSLANVTSIWFACEISACLFRYPTRYFASAPTLAFLTSIVLGQCAAILGKKYSSLLAIVSGLAASLSFAMLWSAHPSRIFEYRGHPRWTGPWDTPNTFGLLMGMGTMLMIPFVGQLWPWGSNETVRESRGGKIVVAKYAVAAFCHGALAVTIFALICSYSRGAWLGTGCGILYLVFSRFGLDRQGRPRSTAVRQPTKDLDKQPEYASPLHRIHSRIRMGFSPHIANGPQVIVLPLATIVAATLVLFFWHVRHVDQHLIRRTLSMVSAADFSWRNRVMAWEGALQIAAEHPWCGVGWYQPQALYDAYYAPPKLDETAAFHLNDYLMIASALGFSTLLCFVAYIGYSLSSSRAETALSGGSPRERDATRLRAACRAGAIVLLVGFWFDGGMFRLPTASTFWILLELGNTTNQAVDVAP